MGLPGAGKTDLASKLVPILDAEWVNADNLEKNTMIGIFLMQEDLGGLKE